MTPEHSLKIITVILMCLSGSTVADVVEVNQGKLKDSCGMPEYLQLVKDFNCDFEDRGCSWFDAATKAEGRGR